MYLIITTMIRGLDSVIESCVHAHCCTLERILSGHPSQVYHQSPFSSYLPVLSRLSRQVEWTQVTMTSITSYPYIFSRSLWSHIHVRVFCVTRNILIPIQFTICMYGLHEHTRASEDRHVSKNREREWIAPYLLMLCMRVVVPPRCSTITNLYVNAQAAKKKKEEKKYKKKSSSFTSPGSIAPHIQIFTLLKNSLTFVYAEWAYVLLGCSCDDKICSMCDGCLWNPFGATANQQPTLARLSVL